MRTAALALALALAACKQTSADGYTFQTKEWERLDSPIVFIVHPSLKDLQAAGPKFGDGTEVMAWSVVSAKPGSTCKVHIVDPKVAYYPEFIGHEVTHCIYGRWHK